MSCSPDLLAAHFEGRISPEDERALREHLLDCQPCRDHYERWSMLSAVDPTMPSLEERMAVALGVAPARAVEAPTPTVLAPSAPAIRRWAMAGGISALALFLGVNLMRAPTPAEITPAAPSAPSIEEGFRARGGDLGVAFAAYKLEGAEAKPVDGAIHTGDGLAFAYENRAGKQHLMIFAVDAKRNVFWYHPAWVDAAENPASITIYGGEARHELDEAVRHDFAPGPLWIHAVFSDEPMTVRELEARLPQDPEKPLEMDGVAAPHPISLEVHP